jgi:hypothetical protein
LHSEKRKRAITNPKISVQLDPVFVSLNAHEAMINPRKVAFQTWIKGELLQNPWSQAEMSKGSQYHCCFKIKV